MSRLKNLPLDPSMHDRLTRFLNTQEIPHFLIFHALDETYASSIAHAFLLDWLEVRLELSSSIDLLMLEPEGKLALHTVAQIEALLKELSLAPYSGSKRGVLIRHMDRMLPASSNALLKTLEEPVGNTLFIGTTQKPHRLLSTIRSRAQEVALPLVSSLSYPEEIQKVASLVVSKIPLRSFSEIFSLSDEVAASIESLVKEKKTGVKDEDIASFFLEESASEVLHALMTYLRSTFPEETQASILHAGRQALDALDTHTSVRDSFLLFFLACTSLQS